MEEKVLMVVAVLYVGKMSLYMLLNVVQAWAILIESRLMIIVLSTVSKG